MNWQKMLDKTVRTIADNSSVLLTVAAVSGTVTTAIFAAKGHAEAQVQMVYDRQAALAEDFPAPKLKDYAKANYKHYIPAAVSGSLTIACVVGIHSVNSRKQAALASAYAVVEKSLTEYREKVVETIGENKEGKIREDISKDRLVENPVVESQVLIASGGDTLCYDSLTGRYFKSDVESIRKAQNDINSDIIANMYASQNDFYALIGLSPSRIGEELGWTTERMMDISFSTHLSEDGRPCLCLDYVPGPIRNYWKAS